MANGSHRALTNPGRRHRPGWRLWRVLLAVLLAVFLLPAASAADSKRSKQDTDAASPREVADKQSDLKSLRAQIEALRQEMVAAEGARQDSIDQLKDAERAISSTQRELHQLATQIATLQARLKELDGQSDALAQQLATQQGQLEGLLYRQYLRGNPDALRLFLNGDDAHQLARDLHYLQAIGRARSQLLLDIESSLHRQKALATDIRQRATELAVAEHRQQQEHAKLLEQRAQRQATLDSQSQQIAAQRREIGKLQRDEKQLGKLIDRLSKIIAARAAEARAAAREAERRALLARQAQARQEKARQELARQEALQQEQPRPDHAVRERVVPPGEPPPAREERREARQEAPPPEPFVGDLARMKGRLRLPARGSVSNRFGSRRQEGTTWKGLFIRAGAGSEVHSIANGRVVFAEWMRGFGNLLIVDHGSDYLSIYANNDSLLKQVGDDVDRGESIATVGNTGGNPESGLYFEIRHQGKPLDPLAWVSEK
ncbi:peptidoglycan DD-metalloendopeptidase family protein [Accumulibacter sp.]|uniref:murein hydrolase activator EnvC family protein n=1 Tax=Accumulibacter sp. TaxID=2053492 RepID=UPI0026011E41|nr:peptidoglycan DD-metalloendopeptidase family protein [Accumulibacter sp.]MCP5228189.1 peptidoglycan DD-metalloendopeptidase family protein [Accumulibacter sp.]